MPFDCSAVTVQTRRNTAVVRKCLKCRQQFVTRQPRKQHLCAPCGDENSLLPDDYTTHEPELESTRIVDGGGRW